MAGPEQTTPATPQASPFGPGVPLLPEGATPDQIDEHWFRHVYQGDKMPQLTVRAVLMGGILGMLMSASNLYTTLTIGWAFGVAITSVVMSYVIWTLLRAFSGGRIGQMSILENVCMASTASAAGYSTGSTIATMFGALLLLEEPAAGETSASVSTLAVQPIWLVAAFTFLTGAMGVFLAIPMKRQQINHERLPFPSGIAAAETLKSLYSKSKEAMLKAYALIIGLVVGGLVGFFKTGSTLGFLDRAFSAIQKATGGTVDAEGVVTGGLNLRLPELIPGHGFARFGPGGFTQADPGSAGGKVKEMIGFGVEPSALLVAAGMIVGLRVSLTMLVGSVLLYFVVAPVLIQQDAPNLLSDGSAYVDGYIPSIELVGGGTIYHIYRWGLWGGTALMVFSSLTTLALQWKTVARAFTKFGDKGAGGEPAAFKKIEVPISWMIAGMLPITIGMVALQILAFSISWYAGLIAVAMSFVLSLVACRATGETDTTPIGAMGKVMQLLFAVLHPGAIVPNLASAGIAANSASSSADLLTDLKSGYLLGANPRKQFLAQFFGLFFGTLAIVPIWYLMVPNKARLEAFPAPATNQWYKVAQVLTKGIETLPQSAQIALLVGSLVGVAFPIIEKLFIPARSRRFFPSAMGLGLSWMLPFVNSLAFAIGAVIAWLWGRAHVKSRDTFNVPLASGLIAGEALIAALIAMTATIIGLAGGGAP